MDVRDLSRRAMAAYFRGAAEEGQVVQPSPPDVVEHEGLSYVVLSNTGGVLAVYRVRTDGVLKRMKRWPAALGSSDC